jgi:hypothetical protein
MNHSVCGRTQVGDHRPDSLTVRALCRADGLFEKFCQDLEERIQVFVKGGAVASEKSVDSHWLRFAKPACTFLRLAGGKPHGVGVETP